MPIKVALSSSLRKYIPSYDPFTGIEFTVDGPIQIKELCHRLNIPVNAVKFAMVNGRHVDMEYQLEGNERVALFPAVGGG